MIQTVRRFGRDNWVALRHEGDPGAEKKSSCGRRGERWRNEGVVRVRVVLGQFAPARERGAPADRNVGMFADEQRIKPTRFDLARPLADVYAVVRWKLKNTN